MKVSHTCTACHITCQNPQWSKYINECLQLWASRLFKGKKKKQTCFALLSKKKEEDYDSLIVEGIFFFKKGINKTHGLNVRVAWSTSSSQFLLGLTPIEIAVTSQWWILVNFMALSKRNRWAVGERRYFFKKTLDIIHWSGRKVHRWHTARGWCTWCSKFYWNAVTLVKVSSPTAQDWWGPCAQQQGYRMLFDAWDGL